MMSGAYKRQNYEDSMFAPGKRKRLNLVAMCTNLFLPWFLFSAVYSCMSFTFHFMHPLAAKGIVAAGFALSAFMGFMAYRQKVREFDPMWYTFASLAFFMATLLGGVFGDMNYLYNNEPYYAMESLNTYPAVNPAKEKGQAMMDTGRAYFVEGAALDNTKSIGFKNVDLYCVAPISYGGDQLATYDFWAIGLNCCSGVSSDFRCGEYNNPHARAGLRLMQDDQRPFFRLAVNMAEAAYNIKSTHPLFFYWVQDPVAELNQYRDDGFKYYLLGVFSYFVFNAFTVACSAYGFSKIGSYY